MTDRRVANRASAVRKRALRRLAVEQPEVYQNWVDIMLVLSPAERSAQDVRSAARTQLRDEFPDRYRELYLEENAIEARVPLRRGGAGRAYNLAIGALRNRYADRYREIYVSTGQSGPAAYHRAVNIIRSEHEDEFNVLFNEYLNDEAKRDIEENGEPEWWQEER